MRIALLYICTGDYIVFWDEFFDSFEEYFLPGYEKEYFVFTDSKEIKGEKTGRVHLQYMNYQPWPIPTLLKFHTFLMLEDKLEHFDYIYQPNSNSRCRQVITAEEFLPRKENGEELFFTVHPGKWMAESYKYPYERNSNSLAYVPYNCEAIGVFGAMNGGEAKSYIRFMKEMAERTAADLKKCVIPIYHDESYINNYLVRHLGDSYIRFLSSDYGYPEEYNIPCERRIELANKEKYFAANSKKNINVRLEKRTIYIKIRDKILLYKTCFIRRCHVFKDKIFQSEPN